MTLCCSLNLELDTMILVLKFIWTLVTVIYLCTRNEVPISGSSKVKVRNKK